MEYTPIATDRNELPNEPIEEIRSIDEGPNAGSIEVSAWKRCLKVGDGIGQRLVASADALLFYDYLTFSINTMTHLFCPVN